jgi:hypothetical protein
MEILSPTLRQRPEIPTWWIFLASLSLSWLTYQLALENNFSADAYYLLFSPDSEAAHHSSGGRPLSALIQWAVNGAGINIIKIQGWTCLVSILLLAGAVTLLHRHLLSTRQSPTVYFAIFSLVCSFLVVCNVFLTEWFTFSFITPMACLAQLLAVAAALRLARSALSLLDGAAVMGLTAASAALFQASASLVVPLGLVLLCLAVPKPRLLVQRTLLALSAYVVSGGVCLIYVRFIHPIFSRLVEPRLEVLNIRNSALAVLKSQPSIWIDTFTLMPRFSFLALCAAACAVFLLIGSARLTPAARWGVLCAAALGIMVSFGPHLLTGVVWIVPRSVTTLPSLPGLLLLAALWFGEAERRLRLAAAALATAYLVLTISCSNRVLADYAFRSREDQQQAIFFYNQLSAYEQRTGQRVTNIAFTLDRIPTWCYPATRCFGDLNVRAWTQPWARLGLMRYVSERTFQEVPFAPHTLPEVFGTDNWDNFSADQIKFDKDTAYVAVY